MKAYKGFNSKLQCTPNGKQFQYEIGKTYEEPEADLCRTGFHACESPLDVFNHYAPAGGRFCKVDLDGVSDERDSNDSKRVGKKITIGAEIGISGLVKAHAEYVKSHIDYKHTDPKQATAGEYGAATAGDSGAATAGNGGAATAGEFGAATAGDRGAATSRGSVSVGENGCGLVRGNDVKAKGGIGAILVICEENEDDCNIKEWKAAIVDGEKIKADTFYKLENGEFVETE
jgi:hypothetical protein